MKIIRLKSIKEKIRFNKKWKIGLSLILGFIFINLLICVISGKNIILSGIKDLWNSLTRTYTEEVKTVTYTSREQDFNNNTPGSFKVTESLEWNNDSTVNLNLDLETVGLNDTKEKDYILVLDKSGSMAGERLDKLKESVKDFADELFQNGNKAGLISYSSSAEILTSFTSSKDTFNSYVDSLTAEGDTNYAAAYKKISELLTTANYTQSDQRDLVILFLTDGYPNIDQNGQIGEYKYLKTIYPNSIFIGIQFDNNSQNITEELKKITESVIKTSPTNLKNTFIKSFMGYQAYDNYQLEYSLDNRQYQVNSLDNIYVSEGEVTLEGDSNNQKIVWKFNNKFITGSTATMNIAISLKDSFKGQGGFFGIKNDTKISYKLKNDNKSYTLTNSESPVLKGAYDITYDTNLPVAKSPSCNVEANFTDTFGVFSTATLRNEELTCAGYQFQGWSISDDTVEGITKLNDENFIMPSHDVVVRAIWSKVNISKSMAGTLHESHTLWDQINTEALNSNGVNLKLGTESEEFPIFFYTADDGGYKNNNNVIFANYCWKIVRTTDTGGIKLIYNGVPASNGTCPYAGNGHNGTDAALSSTSMYNNEIRNAMSQVGYMYGNNSYVKSDKIMAGSINIRETGSYQTTDYLYANSFTYDPSTKRYTLVDPTQYGTWADHYTEVISQGRYTCESAVNTSCTMIRYVYDGTSKMAYKYNLTNGDDKASSKKAIVVSKSYTKNGNNYDLHETEYILREDWQRNYSDYKNYYICGDNFGSKDFSKVTNCEKLWMLNNTGEASFNYTIWGDPIKYGNSVKYQDGHYTLTEDNATMMEFQDWAANYSNITKNHYTCFNGTGECDEVYYIVSGDKERLGYYTLTGGQTIDDIRELVIGADSAELDNHKTLDKTSSNYVNLHDSTIKIFIDNWYKDNMLRYAPYIEDTVYCNNRKPNLLGVWDPNGGRFSNLMFSAQYMSRDLTCPRTVDAFSVSDSIGNGDLTYPVGLLSLNEYYLSGTNVYKTGSRYWTMTPSHFELSLYGLGDGYNFTIRDNGMEIHSSLITSAGVRPVISLRKGVEYSSGNGTYLNPYKVDIA